MFELRLILAVLLLLFGSISIIGNWVLIYSFYFQKKTGSLIPLIGGIFSFVGLLVLPINGIWKLSWIPLFIDIGCFPMVFMSFIIRNDEKTLINKQGRD